MLQHFFRQDNGNEHRWNCDDLLLQAGIVSWRVGRTSCVHNVRRLQGDPNSSKQASRLGESEGVRVHSAVAANSCWIRGTLQCNSSRLLQLIQIWFKCCFQWIVEKFYFSQSCQSNVLRSCADCKKDFKKNTSLSGRRVRGRRSKARSLAVCWQRCKEKPDCRFVNWVNICSHITLHMCDPVAIEQSTRSPLGQLLGQLGHPLWFDMCQILKDGWYIFVLIFGDFLTSGLSTIPASLELNYLQVKEHPSQSRRRQCTLLRTRGSARRERGVVSGSGCWINFKMLSNIQNAQFD